MNALDQWKARQELKNMIAKLMALPDQKIQLFYTIEAMKIALTVDLTKEHFDTLKRRHAGHIKQSQQQ